IAENADAAIVPIRLPRNEDPSPPATSPPSTSQFAGASTERARAADNPYASEAPRTIGDDPSAGEIPDAEPAAARDDAPVATNPFVRSERQAEAPSRYAAQPAAAQVAEERTEDQPGDEPAAEESAEPRRLSAGGAEGQRDRYGRRPLQPRKGRYQAQA